jgi:hypothetical protein
MNVLMLGRLEPDPQIPEWLRSEPRPIPFFDSQTLPFVLDSVQQADEEEINRAIKVFLRLSQPDRFAASRYVFAKYLSVAELVSEADLACRIESEQAVWHHVHPSEVFVSRRSRRDRAIYITIAAECDWEPEHGLQIVYRKGIELVRVSDQDGHLTHTDAYDLPEDQDRIVS